MEHFHWNFGGMTCLAPSALDNIFKDAEVLLPPGGERRGETCLGSLNVSPSDPVKTFQTRLPGFLGPSPGWGWEDSTTGAGCLGVPPHPGTAQSLETPKDARPGCASRAYPFPAPPPPAPSPAARARPRRVFELAGVGAGRGGRAGEG